MNFKFDLGQLLYALPFMLKGMLGIFCITAVIILCIWLLNKLPSGKNDGE